MNIIGKPNVGKSTLVNALVGEKVAIASPKAQTTRHRILGLINHDDYQVVLSDTPGIIDDPKYPMHNAMMDFVRDAWEDADLLLFLLEMGEQIDRARPYLQRLKESGLPFYVVVNKIDKTEQAKLLEYMTLLAAEVPQECIVPISALNKFNTAYLLNLALGHLPEHPAYYDKDSYTDRTERFLAAEIIREKIFDHFKQEIPYSVQVVVTTFKESDDNMAVAAEIYVNRKSQKAILIGKEGRALTRVGTDARRELMNHYNKKVRLDLFVKVKEGWRENPKDLKAFGYTD